MRYDVFGMCNALFDIQAEVRTKPFGIWANQGTMSLIGSDEQKQMCPRLHAHRQHRGGRQRRSHDDRHRACGRACLHEPRRGTTSTAPFTVTASRPKVSSPIWA